MVVKITMPRSVQRVLNYNEQKVKKGVAACIGGEQFLGEANRLTPQEKASVFQRRLELNDRASTRMIHISLNFDPSESLSHEKLLCIASDYMEKIGFGQQPYFVYRHHDTHHPHIHIVSTTIRSNGSRISTHNLGRNASSRARKEIERDYNLVRAESAGKKRLSQPLTTDIRKAEYAKGKTADTIDRIVQTIGATFNYTSLAEFNAVLRLYNVVADDGIEQAGIRSRKGLRYYILDKKGQKTGAGIPAQSLQDKPVIDWLRKRCEENTSCRHHLREVMKLTLDTVLLRQPCDFSAFEQQLSQRGVTALLRANADNRYYGITFIDTHNKSVFNGSELGKEYSFPSLQKIIPFTSVPKETAVLLSPSRHTSENRPEVTAKRPGIGDIGKGIASSAIRDLLTPEKVEESIPAGLLRKKEKRKKKRKQS